MRILVQRVSSASVTVDQRLVSEIKHGLLIFIGVEKGDIKENADYLARKAANLRIFEDTQGKMNLSVKDIQGDVLVVSQFTLAADMSRGNRPGFERAAMPEEAQALYLYFSEQLRKEGLSVANGIFQADMKVALINDGPATFWLEKN